MSVKAWRNSSPRITHMGNGVTPVGNGSLPQSSRSLWVQIQTMTAGLKQLLCADTNSRISDSSQDSSKLNGQQSETHGYSRALFSFGWILDTFG